jgi:hypothetical protein
MTGKLRKSLGCLEILPIVTASGTPVTAECRTPDYDLIAVKIHVLDAQFERLLQSEARPVEKRNDDPRNACQLIQDGAHFVDTEHHRHA